MRTTTMTKTRMMKMTLRMKTMRMRMRMMRTTFRQSTTWMWMTGTNLTMKLVLRIPMRVMAVQTTDSGPQPLPPQRLARKPLMPPIPLLNADCRPPRTTRPMITTRRTGLRRLLGITCLVADLPKLSKYDLAPLTCQIARTLSVVLWMRTVPWKLRTSPAWSNVVCPSK